MVCPGSRSAPLALAFLRDGRFTCYTASDERSAAFIALGVAQQTRRPVVLVCTSGSAAYNFAPAIAEAYFQHVPLVVITADRPREWIDQLDGQAIFQPNLFGSHVKRYAELPHDFGHEDSSWFANRVINELVNLAVSFPQGPVHLNAPFREPLYPGTGENQGQKTKLDPRVIESVLTSRVLNESDWSTILKTINQSKKILMVPGQAFHQPGMISCLADFLAEHRWPIAGDILSNLHGLPSLCRRADTFLGQLPEKLKASLQPDLLITFGQSLIAKNLKLFLRQFGPKTHWHIQPGGQVADTYKHLTRVLPVEPLYFFSELHRRKPETQVTHRAYADEWQQHEVIAANSVEEFFSNQAQGEFALVHSAFRALPERCNLHLANSMSVRYANHIGLSDSQKGVRVYSNRGTSGIDGCTSTAVGHALSSPLHSILLTGDQAFFYDRNAFWHNYPLPNLSVIVLNNHGGIIFNLIDGPSRLPEAEEYFVTRQSLRAKALADELGFAYSDGQNPNWREFFQAGSNARIHEIETSQSMTKSVFELFKKQIKKSYET